MDRYQNPVYWFYHTGIMLRGYYEKLTFCQQHYGFSMKSEQSNAHFGRKRNVWRFFTRLQAYSIKHFSILYQVKLIFPYIAHLVILVSLFCLQEAFYHQNKGGDCSPPLLYLLVLYCSSMILRWNASSISSGICTRRISVSWSVTTTQLFRIFLLSCFAIFRLTYSPPFT